MAADDDITTSSPARATARAGTSTDPRHDDDAPQRPNGMRARARALRRALTAGPPDPLDAVAAEPVSTLAPPTGGPVEPIVVPAPALPPIVPAEPLVAPASPSSGESEAPEPAASSGGREPAVRGWRPSRGDTGPIEIGAIDELVDASVSAPVAPSVHGPVEAPDVDAVPDIIEPVMPPPPGAPEPAIDTAEDDEAAEEPKQPRFRRRRRHRVRRVTRVIRHVDTWSVFKIALVFNMVLYLVCLTAGVLLWNVAYSTGTIDNVQRFFEQFGWSKFRFKGGEIYHAGWIAGLFAIVGFTGFAVLLATLFNLITDLVGGIRVTVLEEEVIAEPRTITAAKPVRRPRHSTTTVPAIGPTDDPGVPEVPDVAAFEVAATAPAPADEALVDDPPGTPGWIPGA